MTATEQETRLPLLPLRDVVVFPHIIVPLAIGRPKSIKALDVAMAGNKTILLVAQKSSATDDPSASDIYETGCVANVLQYLKLPDGTVKALVEGVSRARITDVRETDTHLTAEARHVRTIVEDPREIEALRRAIAQQIDKLSKQSKVMTPEIVASLNAIPEPERYADTLVSHLPLKLEYKQVLLETTDIVDRLAYLLEKIDGQIEIMQVEKKIHGHVKRAMEKSQRNYYLNEQVKAIQKELGEAEEGNDIDELEKKIEAAKMSKEAQDKAKSELRKLRLMSSMSPEASVVRNYIETLVALPWKKKTKINNNLARAEKILEDDHYGLNRIKERILEYLAVQQRVDKVKAPILCFVGPPGVGKTSLGQSIARATNRKFIRMALGGVRDEAEIRGHRRTYIGSLPGKILQNMTKAGVRNPLFLLDEVDKLGQGFRGDPAAALLEVLDPELNHTFSDHYVEVDFDLSDVMFIATSNTTNMPPALLDRMEVIRLSGYTEDEKVNIAQRYLIPKQFKGNGLKTDELRITETAIRNIIRYYTREAGVRGLEREISRICRKVVKTALMKKKSSTVTVAPKNIDRFLGVRQYDFGVAEKDNRVGQVSGLAWTEVGGEMLTVEAVIVPGKGEIIRTGKLGDVMKESIEAAKTVVRTRAKRLGIDSEAFEKTDIHIHVPEGATPKDGPSAGISMATALVSTYCNIPVRADVAMTGEITLRGEVLLVGGLKEKLLAALRGGIKTVIIPEENVKDLVEIPDNVKNKLEIVPVRWFDKVLEIALESQPATAAEEGEQSKELAADVIAPEVDDSSSAGTLIKH